MKLGNIKIAKRALALLGVAAFIFLCLGGLWIYSNATLPKSKTLTLTELGGANNRVLRTVTVPFASDERSIFLQWAWDAPTNRSPEIHVVCDLINEAKAPVLFLVEGTDADYAKIEPGNSTRFFDGNLADLVFAGKVHFRTEPAGGMKKLSLRMRFDKDFTPEQPIKVQLLVSRPVL
jgi:hypothetical protein